MSCLDTTKVVPIQMRNVLIETPNMSPIRRERALNEVIQIREDLKGRETKKSQLLRIPPVWCIYIDLGSTRWRKSANVHTVPTHKQLDFKRKSPTMFKVGIPRPVALTTAKSDIVKGTGKSDKHSACRVWKISTGGYPIEHSVKLTLGYHLFLTTN